MNAPTGPLHRAPAQAPVGYFVHHQGRGHAERCADLVNTLHRPVTIFCARDDIFPPLRPGVEIIVIPSLFEPSGAEELCDTTQAPDTVHCAPLGWPGIRQAMAIMANWFAAARPALMICDVSAEVAQLARLCSVPHVKVLQHGLRDDPGHRAAYDGAVGLLAPCHGDLAQPDWTGSMGDKIHFAPGLGVRPTRPPSQTAARARLALDPGREVVLVITGGGGTGYGSAPIAVGARARPDAQWITLGQIARDWHATEPGNLRHDGWVSGIADHLAAADLVVASTGNTLSHQILAVGRPWLAVPEWRYFDEQVEKAKALHRAGAAHHLPHLPASLPQWRAALADTLAAHDPARQHRLIAPHPARDAARWLEARIAALSLRPVTPGACHDPAPVLA